ncbi:MAG TPA: RNA polymerase sigma factor [Bacteroidota bacterium]|nr:RNA polymerase sigma factor [Bacteroidota bacterium]
MPLNNEAQLIERVRKGEEGAFRELVECHMKRAYNVAFGFLGDHEAAEDVTQEAFINVYRSIQNFRGDSELGTWIHRIVANLSMTKLKRLRLKRAREVELQKTDDTAAPENPGLEQKENRYHIERALHELPTLQRAVVLLRHMEGLSTKQVGKILNCSEGTVKTHLFRGLRKMREHLDFLRDEVVA